jgi:hypothetical protein
MNIPLTKVVGFGATTFASVLCAIVFLVIALKQYKEEYHTGGGKLSLTIVVGLVATIAIFGTGVFLTKRFVAKKQKLMTISPLRAQDM